MNRKGKTWAWWGLGIGLLGYWLLPYLLVQVAGWGLIREGRQGVRRVALTFDDGPHPETTPLILDALKEAGVKATFFVIIPQVKKYPELLARLLAEGHEVAPHAIKHKHGWVRSPWGAFRETVGAVRELEKLTGQRARFHRPPHGAYTLAVLAGQWWTGVRGAHWSLEGHDWHPKFDPQQVGARIEYHVRGGSVIVLHDAGIGGKVTAQGLKDWLKTLAARGYEIGTLGKLNASVEGWSQLRARAMGKLDDFYDTLNDCEWVESRRDSLLRIGRSNLPFKVAEHEQGMPALEFHVNSALMIDMGVKRAVRASPRELRLIATELVNNTKYADVVGVYCISSLSPLLRILGFGEYTLPPVMTTRLQGWAFVLRRGHGTQTNPAKPTLSFLSREAFLAKYPPLL